MPRWHFSTGCYADRPPTPAKTGISNWAAGWLGEILTARFISSNCQTICTSSRSPGPAGGEISRNGKFDRKSQRPKIGAGKRGRNLLLGAPQRSPAAWPGQTR